MEWVEKIQLYIVQLDEKRFYQYLIGFLAITTILIALLVFYYYRSMQFYINKAQEVNEQREKVKIILDKAQHVKQQEKTILELIKEDENFKIAGYFKELIDQQGLSSKQASKSEVTSPSAQGKYQESVLTAKFAEITMKQLVTLLQAIDQNKRVYTKELDITESNKNADTINVGIIIATVEPKQEPFEGEDE